MKISDLNPAALNGLSTGSISSSGIGAYGRTGRGAYGSSADQVQLSGASRIASSAMAAHAARLTQLKSQIMSGSYNPAGGAIAESILTEALARSS
jgi:anti-sigma28 factor (negative regulator of flagellin synthesis)